MPQYTYKCEKCDKKFVGIRSIANRESCKCECGNECARDAEIEADGISNPTDKYQMSVRLEDGRLVKGNFYA
jgi:putative FmdB family regulatory protein